MRADLPDAVAEAIARCDAPALVFDRARIAANLDSFAAAARAAGITMLFAAKSFPHPVVRALAAERFDGFDAASPGELAELPPARIVSIVDPTGRAGAAVPAGRFARAIVGCETVEQVRAAPPGADIAIRLSTSLGGRDPAVGAVQDGGGHRRSRFGLDVDPARRAATLRELAGAWGDRTAGAGAAAAQELAGTRVDAAAQVLAGVDAAAVQALSAARVDAAAVQELAGAAGRRRIGLHIHHGAVAATGGARFAATARATLAAAADAGLEPAFIDVGGAWHAVADLPAALAELRAAVPAGIEVIVEPGRAIAEGAGFACGRIVAARELDDRLLCVADLSRICHLRWSAVELVGRAPHPGSGRDVLVAGPTCFEDDVLGNWTVERLGAGDRIVLRDVTGYAVAWNHGFGGIPAAGVILT